MQRAQETLNNLLLRWLVPIAGAIPIVGFYIAWRKWGGWLWPTLFIGAIILLMAVGIWDLSRPWDDD